MKLVQLVTYGKCIIGVEITRIKTLEKTDRRTVVDHLRLKLQLERSWVEGHYSSLLSNAWSSQREKSILGHMDNQSFEEIYHGKEYNKLEGLMSKKNLMK